MIKKEIKEIAEKYGKKIGEMAIAELNKEIGEYLEGLIKVASRQAEYFGRNTIKEEDLKRKNV